MLIICLNKKIKNNQYLKTESDLTFEFLYCFEAFLDILNVEKITVFILFSIKVRYRVFLWVTKVSRFYFLFQEAIGFELWTMSKDILFDNIIITDEYVVAERWAADTFEKKRQKIAKDSVSILIHCKTIFFQIVFHFRKISIPYFVCDNFSKYFTVIF